VCINFGVIYDSLVDDLVAVYHVEFCCGFAAGRMFDQTIYQIIGQIVKLLRKWPIVISGIGVCIYLSTFVRMHPSEQGS